MGIGTGDMLVGGRTWLQCFNVRETCGIHVQVSAAVQVVLALGNPSLELHELRVYAQVRVSSACSMSASELVGSTLNIRHSAARKAGIG